MGAEEGKKVWGAQEWRKIVARVRNGAVWDEAIAAYGGEGKIDGDVVNALYAPQIFIFIFIFAPVFFNARTED